MSKNFELMHQAGRDREIGPFRKAEAVIPAQNGNEIDQWDEPQSMTLQDYWAAVRNHMGLVIGVVLFITLPIALLLLKQPNYYDSTARVQIDYDTAFISATPGAGAAMFAADPAYFNTQLELVESPTLLRKVVRALNLNTDPVFLRYMRRGGRIMRWILFLSYVGKADTYMSKNPPITESLEPATTPEEMAEAQRLKPYVEDLSEKLKVEPVKEDRNAFKDTRLVEITMRYPNPQLGAQIANAVGDSLVLFYREQKAKAGTIANKQVAARIAELQTQIQAGEQRLGEYAKSNQILSLEPSENTVVDRLVSLNRQLVEAEKERNIAESRRLTGNDDKVVGALAEESYRQIAGLHSQVADLRQKRAQLLVTATEKWPPLIQLNEQIVELERQIEIIRTHESEVLRTNLETRYKQAKAYEGMIRAAFEKQRKATLVQNAAAVTFRLIQQENETNKRLLDGLLARLGENEAARVALSNNIRVVDYATVPDKNKPNGPYRSPFIALAFLVSLSLGLGLAIFLESVDHTLRSSIDVKKALQLPSLAIIPHWPISAAGRSRLPGLVSNLWPKSNGNGQHALLLDPRTQSPLLEAYRRLRTAVLVSLVKRTAKKILVTSSTAGEGKTTTSINLAMSLAQNGARVLVVDCDLHRPRVHSMMGMTNGTGLSQYLDGTTNDIEAPNLVQKNGEKGLNLLSAGPPPNNPAELLGSNRMRRLLALLEPQYDYLILDSRPIGSCSDSVLLSRLVDGVLVVVHGGKISREIVCHTCDVLREVGAPLLGVVLNNVKNRPRDYDYYSYAYDESK